MGPSTASVLGRDWAVASALDGASRRPETLTFAKSELRPPTINRGRSLQRCRQWVLLQSLRRLLLRPDV
jgi:hypothetical protein